MPSLKRATVIPLVLVCAAVFWFCVRTADHHLPYLQYSNEASNISQAVVVANKGLVPASLQRPTLPVYLLAAVDWSMLQTGRLTGVYEPEGVLPAPKMWDLGLALAASAPEVVVANRIACAAVGAGTVWLIFLLTRELFGNSRMALIAALFASVSGVIIKGSIIVRPEIFMCFFVTLALIGAARVLKRGRRSDYLWAGLWAGLACSSKYNAALVVFSLAAAHFCSESQRPRRHSWLMWAAAMCVLGFFLGTPYAAIEYERFITDLGFELAHYQSGHLGRDDGDMWDYLRIIGFKEGAVAWLALAGAVLGLLLRSRPILMLLAFGLPYLVAISILPVRMDRHVTPLLPVVIPCAALLVDTVFTVPLRRAWELRSWLWGTAAGAVIAGIVFVIGSGIERNSLYVDNMTGENGRDLARAWIRANIPTGSVIAVESRGPWIDRRDYHVRRIPVSYSTSALWLHSPRWYAEHGFDYLIMSSRVQGLYRQSPDRYIEQVAAYRHLNVGTEVVEIFNGRGWGIAVLRIPDWLKPKTPTPTPPWFLWSGPKDPAPIQSGEPWPVVIWEGPRPPMAYSLVGLSKTSRFVKLWLQRSRREGLFVPLGQYEENRKKAVQQE